MSFTVIYDYNSFGVIKILVGLTRVEQFYHNSHFFRYF